ncbi:MAG: DUF6624 domain-containing protein [Bacteroidota bacterium]
MKNPIILLFLLLLVACQPASPLEKIDEDVLIQKILNNDMPNPESLLIKNLQGERISVDSLRAMESTGKYFEDFYVDQTGTIKEVIVREKTAADDSFFKKMSRLINPEPIVQERTINCNEKGILLDSVYTRDQAMRQTGQKIDRDIDHDNLEIVVSILEQCGMPTLEEVTDQQMRGLWLVLQHAPPSYQKKYIPMLEKAAERGDIRPSVIALFKDRALMFDNQPQIYGTQIRNGELYDLMDPEYVDQRRAEIGLGPLKDYVERFDLEFTVEQKTK